MLIKLIKIKDNNSCLLEHMGIWSKDVYLWIHMAWQNYRIHDAFFLVKWAWFEP